MAVVKSELVKRTGTEFRAGPLPVLSLFASTAVKSTGQPATIPKEHLPSLNLEGMLVVIRCDAPLRLDV